MRTRMHTRRHFLQLAGLGATSVDLSRDNGHARMQGRQLRNIVYVTADDLGYGDVRCHNPQAKIHTPITDNLAKQGIRFTDADSPAA